VTNWDYPTAAAVITEAATFDGLALPV